MHADEVATNDGECRGRCYSEVRFLSKHSDSGIDVRSLTAASLHKQTPTHTQGKRHMRLCNFAAYGA